MAQEPSLSEISNYSQGAQTKGEVAAPIDISSGLKGVWEAAKSKNENDWNKYALYTKNIAEYMQNNKVDYTGVLPEDKEKIMGKAAVYFKMLADDPSAIGDPAKNPAMYAKMNGVYSSIQSDVAKSKQDAGYAELQEKYRMQNPELYNETNNKKYKDWRANTDRKASELTWDIPKPIDVASLSSLAKGSIGSDSVDWQEQYVPDADAQGNPLTNKLTGKPQMKYTGQISYTPKTTYDPAKYMQRWEQMYDMDENADPTGKVKFASDIKESVKSLFKALPSTEKEKYVEGAKSYEKGGVAMTPEKLFWMHTGQEYWGKYENGKAAPMEVINADKVKHFTDKEHDELVKYGYDAKLKNLEYSHQRTMEAIRFGDEKSLAVIKHNIEGEPFVQQVKAFKNLYDDFINKRQEGTHTIDLGNGHYSTEPEIETTPELKKKFGIGSKNILKHYIQGDPGPNTALTPDSYEEVDNKPADYITRTKDGGVRAVRYKRDDKDKIMYEGKKPIAEMSEAYTKREAMVLLTGGLSGDKKTFLATVDAAAGKSIPNRDGQNEDRPVSKPKGNRGKKSESEDLQLQ